MMQAHCCFGARQVITLASTANIGSVYIRPHPLSCYSVVVMQLMGRALSSNNELHKAHCVACKGIPTQSLCKSLVILM